MVPKSLKNWFLVHFIVDMFVGIPLMVSPTCITQFLGVDSSTFTVRLLAAVFLAVGGISIVEINSKPAVYKTMLKLKIIWSFSAIIAIILTLIENSNPVLWLILFTFLLFNLVWVHFYNKL